MYSFGMCGGSIFLYTHFSILFSSFFRVRRDRSSDAGGLPTPGERRRRLIFRPSRPARRRYLFTGRALMCGGRPAAAAAHPEVFFYLPVFLFVSQLPEKSRNFSPSPLFHAPFMDPLFFYLHLELPWNTKLWEGCFSLFVNLETLCACKRRAKFVGIFSPC